MQLMYNSPVGRRIFFLCFSILCVFSIAAFGQNARRAQAGYKLLSVHVKGLTHFKEEEIVSASGLKLGQAAQEEDFKQALQKLGDTGLFSNLNYTYHYSTAGCELNIQLSENEQLFPVIFDNFVWFSDEELVRLLHARVPLFTGRLPMDGNLPDSVSDALNAILAERHIPGKADYLRSASLGGPIDAYDYKVNLHPVIIREVTFPGAAAPELPSLQQAARPLSGQEYLRSKMRPQEKFTFLPVYLSRGYLNAKFRDAEAKVVSDGPRTVVDVSLPVTPGIQYKVTQIKFAGNSAFPSDQLQELIHLKPGEPANAVELSQDIESMQKLYGTKGYLTAHINPAPAMEDSNASVSYQINVIEGDQYRMGELQIDGLDDAAIKRIQAQWQLKNGDPYDNSYLRKFFQLTYRDATLSRSYNIVQKESVDPQSKTVSLALHFMPK